MSTGNAPEREAAGAILGMIRLEFRRSVGLLAVPLLLLGAWWLVISDVMTTEVLLWSQVSHLTIATAFVLAPAAGGLSAWEATRNRRRGVEEMLSVTARPQFARELAAWAGTMLWPLLACAAITGFYALLALRDATWGGPLPAPLLLGLLYVAAYSAVGYAAGRWVPSRFTAPLVAVGLFYGAWGLLLLPPWEFGSLLGPDPNAIAGVNVFEESLGLWGWRISWVLGLCGVALSAVALKARTSVVRWSVLAACGLAAFGSAAAILGLTGNETLAREHGVYEFDPIPYEPVCEDGRVEVCVHPAYERLLPEIFGTINKVARPLEGVPDAPTRAVQAENTTTYDDERDSAPDVATFDVDTWLWGDGGWEAENAAHTLTTNQEVMEYALEEPDTEDG